MNDHDQKPTATPSRMPVAASAAPETTTAPALAVSPQEAIHEVLEVGRRARLVGRERDTVDDLLDAGLDPLDGVAVADTDAIELFFGPTDAGTS